MLKTPVSILQELTVEKKIAAPNYQVEGTGQPHCMSFTCRVVTGNQTAIGLGNTKKDAKQNAARNMLIQFGINLDNNKASISSLCLLPTKTNKLDGPMINYIGKLNEFCSGHKQPLPTYTDSVTVQNAQFCIVCNLKDFKAEGYGLNKKDAKQDAARKMLLQIKETDYINFTSDDAPKELTVIDNDLSEQVINKYTDLMKNIKIVDDKNGNNNNNINNLETIHKELNISTWDELVDLLEKRGYRYELTTFQAYPLILSLKINEHVLMNCGIKREEIKTKLVIDTINMFKKGIDFSKPLIDL